MQRNSSVVGSHIAKRVLHLIGLDECGEHRNIQLNMPRCLETRHTQDENRRDLLEPLEDRYDRRTAIIPWHMQLTSVR